jgi:tRNA U38,U39,U40 pseudouridine synthase TruA
LVWASFRRRNQADAGQKDRRVAGMTAPAHGLVLWKVFIQNKSKDAKSKPKLKNRVFASKVKRNEHRPA